MTRLASFLLFLLFLAPASSGQALVEALLQGPDEATRGSQFFDIVASDAEITLCGFDLILGSALETAVRRQVDIQIYARPGSAAGFESSGAGWMLHHEHLSVDILAGGPNTLHKIVLDTPIVIPRNDLSGIAIFVGDTADPTRGRMFVDLQPSTTPYGITHIGTNLFVTTGRGTAFPGFDPLSATFQPVDFIGNIYYVLGNSCTTNLTLPTSVVGPNLDDATLPPGAFQPGRVTIIQGNSLGRATVAPGSCLTVSPGAIIKPMPGVSLEIQGQAQLDGARFTSFRDDSWGGDSNGDGGGTMPAPGDWGNIDWGPSSTGVMRETSVRYAGDPGVFSADVPAVRFNGPSVSVIACSFEHNDSVGTHTLDFNGNATPVEVRSNLIADNTGGAIGGVPFGHLPAFRDNFAVNNAQGDHIEAEAGPAAPRAVAGVTRIERRSLRPGRVLVVRGEIVVTSNGRLEVAPDMIIKFHPSSQGGLTVLAGGELKLAGQPSRPVVLTSFADDSSGGDTNLDGPSTGQPGDWGGIHINGGNGGVDATADLLNVQLMFAGLRQGNLPTPGVFSSSPAVCIREARVSELFASGIRLEMAIDIVNAEIANCGGVGVDITGGSADLVHVTCRGNAGGGVAAAPSWTGALRNSNFWDNTNFDIDPSINPFRVFRTNGLDPTLGDPSAGNMNVAPLFVDSITGRLSPSSPLVDQADAAFGTGRLFDVEGNSAVNGAAPDMGANEVASTRLVPAGELAEGDSFTVDLLPDLPMNPNFLAISFTPGELMVPGLGTVVGGTNPNAYLFMGPYFGATQVVFEIPELLCFDLEGIPFSVQGLGVGHSGSVEMTNGWVGTFRGTPAISDCP